MTARKRNWIVAAGLGVLLIAAGLTIAASLLAARIEPYARQTVIRYLSQRFNSDVQLQALHMRLQGSRRSVCSSRAVGGSRRVLKDRASLCG